MTTMFTELTLPELPRWATDVGATLEPSEAKKDEGNVVAKRPPARWDNWIKNQSWQYCQQTIRTIISNWKLIDYTTKPASADSVIYNPEHGVWVVCESATPDAWISYDGHNFISDASTGTAVERRSIAVDSTYTLIGLGVGVILRRDSAGAYTSILSAAIGGAGGIDTIITKYPTSDLAMVTRSGVIRRAPTGVGGSWVAATTPPPAPITTQDQKLVWAGGTTFFLSQGAGGATKTYVSTDDGDNWAVTTTFPFAGLSTGSCADMAINPDNGMLVVVGYNDSSSAHIEWSDDSGVSWNVATIDMDGTPATQIPELTCVYYCGQGHWVAAGTGTSILNGILVSSDGENWSRASVESELINNIYDIHASTRMLVAVGDSGVTTSLGTGAFNP